MNMKKDDSRAGPCAGQFGVLAAGQERTDIVITGISGLCDDVPTSTFWDTAVNFDNGDAVTISGPYFNFDFVSSHEGTISPGLTLHATAPGGLTASVTFANHAKSPLNGEARATSDSGSSGANIHLDFDGVSEPLSPYRVAKKEARRVIVPVGTTLTPRVLLSALLKMRSPDIEDAIENLIEELNARYGNSDDEPEPDEPEPEACIG